MFTRCVFVIAITFATLQLSVVSGQIVNPNRFVQIRAVNFDTGIIELHNFGANEVEITNWFFCTQDENENFEYTTRLGFGAGGDIVLAPAQSYFIHANDDADPTNSNQLNLSTIGTGFGDFALPVDANGAYSLALYVNSFFGNGNNMADFVQWSTDGIDNAFAGVRSDEAENGGVWIDRNEWIDVSPETQTIELFEVVALNELHSADSYEVVGREDFAIGDVNRDGSINLLDVAPFVALISSGEFNIQADVNRDGSVNLLDVSPFVDLLAG